MTSLFDPAERRRNTLDVAIDWLACGLDPQHSVFWRQSDVPEVVELMWILGTLTPMGLLERATSYKDKTAKGISRTSAFSPIRCLDGGGYFCSTTRIAYRSARTRSSISR